MTAYSVGDHIRIDGRCDCGELIKPGKGGVLALRQSSTCWHGPKTIVLRVFASGDYLLENGHGYVRLAGPHEVCC